MRTSTIARLPDGSLLLGAASALASTPDATAAAALVLDPAFARQIAGQVGLPVAILDPERALADAEDPRMPLRAEVLATGKPGSGRLKAAGLYVSVRPLRAPSGDASSGEISALVETALPRGAVASSLARLVRELLLLSLLVAAFATLSGFLISRRLTRPVQALTASAARIGRGDLSTPTPRAPAPSSAPSPPPWRRCAAACSSSPPSCAAGRPRGRRSSPASSKGCSASTATAASAISIRRRRRCSACVREDAVGRFCGDVLKPRGKDGSPAVRRELPDRPRPLPRRRHAPPSTCVRPDGTRRAVVITSAPPTEDQQFQVLRDETDVEVGRRQRDAVLANISHEFRTPLAAQLASIELLRDRLLLQDPPAASTPQTRDLVLALERGSLRLTQLIDNLLESVRIESGQDSIRSRPVALDEVVEEAVEMTAPLLAQRGQAVEVELPYPLPAVRGDAPRLTQVFVNLLANANKFAPAGFGGARRRRGGGGAGRPLGGGRGAGPARRGRERRAVRPLRAGRRRQRERRGAGAGRHGARALDRALDRRAARRHHRGGAGERRPGDAHAGRPAG